MLREAGLGSAFSFITSNMPLSMETWHQGPIRETYISKKRTNGVSSTPLVFVRIGKKWFILTIHVTGTDVTGRLCNSPYPFKLERLARDKILYCTSA